MTASVRHATHVASGEDVEPLWGGEWLSQGDAFRASNELRERMERAIFKWGFRHGIDHEQARDRLLNGRKRT
jgi:hypothetical protein